jgi:hypothetical protein
MIIIFWPPLGFHVMQTLQAKDAFTTEFFVGDVLPDGVTARPHVTVFSLVE